jgi:hypothetical protein
MNFNAAVPMQIQPKFSEGSNLGISSRDDRNTSKLWKKCEVMVKNAEVVQRNLDKTIRAVSKLRLRRMAYMPGGDSWPPVELDTTVAHSIGDRVYISPGNILVTSGMIDLDSNILMVSLPGIWRAVTAVPAAVSSQYNVPQLPIPGAYGAVPSGTPMKGDADGAQVHWLPEWINDYCSQNP